MTENPADLLALRATVMRLTGLANPADVGIKGDPAHAATGGYHEGRDDLIRVGRYHPAAAAGSSTEDYSVRLARDRAGLTNSASAVDIGDDWPVGGRAAWLRFNQLVVAALQGGDLSLGEVRAVNYSPDGVSRHRIDRQHGFGVVQDTSDLVEIHTHIEWYRDTEGHRQVSLARLAELIQLAITATEDDMTPAQAASLANIDAQVNTMVRMAATAHLSVGGQPNELGKTLTGIAVDAHAAANRPVQVTMNDADRQAIARQVSADLGGKLDQVLAAIRAAGQAAG